MEQNLMKAQVETEPDVWKYQEVSVPAPGDGEVLLKLRVCALRAGDSRQGYGFFGTVRELGSGVDSLEIGDRVAACMVDGNCFSDYVCVREENCCRLSEELDDYTSAFVAPLAYVLRTVEMTVAPLAQPCIVEGAHLLRIALACARGLAPVIAVVNSESERSAVLKIGADYAVNTEKCDDVASEVESILGGRDAAVTIKGDQTVPQAAGPLAWDDAITLLTYRRVDLKPLYAVAVPLADLPAALQEMDGERGPVVVFIDTSLKSRFTFPGYREPVSATLQL